MPHALACVVRRRNSIIRSGVRATSMPPLSVNTPRALYCSVESLVSSNIIFEYSMGKMKFDACPVDPPGLGIGPLSTRTTSRQPSRARWCTRLLPTIPAPITTALARAGTSLMYLYLHGGAAWDLWRVRRVQSGPRGAPNNASYLHCAPRSSPGRPRVVARVRQDPLGQIPSLLGLWGLSLGGGRRGTLSAGLRIRERGWAPAPARRLFCSGRSSPAIALGVCLGPGSRRLFCRKCGPGSPLGGTCLAPLQRASL